MPLVRRLLMIAGLLVGVVLYVWVAAVRAAPRVRARKAEQRARWRERAAAGADHRLR